jgi:hypothetical protein
VGRAELSADVGFLRARRAGRRRGASTLEYVSLLGLVALAALLALRASGIGVRDKAFAQARCIATFSACSGAPSGDESLVLAEPPPPPGDEAIAVKATPDTKEGAGEPQAKPAAQETPPVPWPEGMSDADIEVAMQTLPGIAMYQYPNLQGSGLLSPPDPETGAMPLDELTALTRSVLAAPDEVKQNALGSDYIAYLGHGQTVTVMVIVNGLTGLPEVTAVSTSIEGASDPFGECFDGAVSGDLSDTTTTASLGCQVGVGFIPVVGTAADVRDLGAAAKEGDGVGVVVSIIGFLPFGDVAKSIWRFIRRGGRHVDEAVEVAQAAQDVQRSVMQARLDMNEELLRNNAFTHNRGLLSPGGYRSMLGEMFFSRLGSLQPGDIWMDMGAGSFNAIDEFYSQVPGSAGVRTAGLNYELPPDNALTALRAEHGTVDFSGRYAEDYAPEEIIDALGGRVDLMSDVYGPLTYSSKIDDVLQLYGDVLDVGGQLHIKIVPHGWDLVDSAGARVMPEDFFRRAGFEVSGPVVDPGNGWQYVLTRTDTPIDVPELELILFDPQVLPHRRFRLVDPAGGG